jgi:hypothetical protein
MKNAEGALVGDTAAQIAELMRTWISVGHTEMERRHGALASEVAHEVEGALMAAMESSLSYVVLWEQFLSTPDEVVLAIVSVVQALMDADPVLARWLGESLERYGQVAEA